MARNMTRLLCSPRRLTHFDLVKKVCTRIILIDVTRSNGIPWITTTTTTTTGVENRESSFCASDVNDINKYVVVERRRAWARAYESWHTYIDGFLSSRSMSFSKLFSSFSSMVFRFTFGIVSVSIGNSRNSVCNVAQFVFSPWMYSEKNARENG